MFPYLYPCKKYTCTACLHGSSVYVNDILDVNNPSYTLFRDIKLVSKALYLNAGTLFASLNENVSVWGSMKNTWVKKAV